MRLLHFGSRGPDVTRWQEFLVAQRLLADRPDGVFGARTREATQEFQRAHALPPDGAVGPNTRRVAEAAAGAEHAASPSAAGEPACGGEPFWPPRPSFGPLGTEGRNALFGRFAWALAPTSQNPEAIRVLDDWPRRNLARVELRQLAGVPFGWGGVCKGVLQVHRLAAEPLRRVWAAWEAAGLLRHVDTFDGAYDARLTRGTTTTLSPHAWGTAFDLNASTNGLGSPPAPAGARGCLLELVELANEHGFYWGGHFSRSDGMHFELARLP